MSFVRGPNDNDFFNNVGNVVKTAVVKTTAGLSGSWILYSLVALFVCVVILMLLNIKIDLSWLDIRPKRYVVRRDAHLYWEPSAVFTNLKVAPEQRISNFDDTVYSMIVDCVLYNSRVYTTEEGPYRHIVHRGSDELASNTIGGMVLSGCASANNGELPPYGLPKRMNPGVFLDPNTNDIIVFVDTSNGSEQFRESLRIQDIPLGIPFRLGVVVHGRVVEVYLNCRLEVTKVLSADPKEVENDWYGLSGKANAEAQIQNMYVWERALPSDDMRTLCQALPEFNSKRPICSGADSVTPPTPMIGSAAPTPASTDLGIRNALCK